MEGAGRAMTGQDTRSVHEANGSEADPAKRGQRSRELVDAACAILLPVAVVRKCEHGAAGNGRRAAARSVDWSERKAKSCES